VVVFFDGFLLTHQHHSGNLCNPFSSHPTSAEVIVDTKEKNWCLISKSGPQLKGQYDQG